MNMVYVDAGAFLIVGVLAFPAGWDDPSVQEICGPASRDFYPGQCGLRWAYILAMIGVADILVLSALAFTLAVRHVKLLSLQPYPVAALYKGNKELKDLRSTFLTFFYFERQVKAIKATSPTNDAVQWHPDPTKWWWSPAEQQDRHQDQALWFRWQLPVTSTIGCLNIHTARTGRTIPRWLTGRNTPAQDTNSGSNVVTNYHQSTWSMIKFKIDWIPTVSRRSATAATRAITRYVTGFIIMHNDHWLAQLGLTYNVLVVDWLQSEFGC